MNQESFSDPEVARILNQYYISVKVDREERPDVDQFYMDLCQLLTGSGGWPLNCILTPEKEPIYLGTYFPPQNQYGRLGLTELLTQIAEEWQADPQKLKDYARQVVTAARSHLDPTIHDSLPMKTMTPEETELKEFIKQAFLQLKSSFDHQYGGFGKAPKFPSPHTLSFLLRHSLITGDRHASEMVQKTLDCMGKGGIYDHIGYGFSRYSTEEKWLIPHFEKMLYDNALLAIAYLESYQLSHRGKDENIAREIFTYVTREMTAPGGGFFSAEDADSEGKEGLFYLWSIEEVKQALDEKSASLMIALYNMNRQGNFEGKNILNQLKSDKEKLALSHNITLGEVELIIKNSRNRLLAQRQKRIHPFKDDKILTGWNGLMIAAFAKGAQILGEKTYLVQAENALHFILDKLRRPSDGRLMARYRENEAAHLACLDDYAYLIWGILELYQAGGNPRYIRLVLELQNQQDELFRDQSQDDYFFSGIDGDSLLFRSKTYYDGALPSGNSVSAMNLLRIASLTNDRKWEEKSLRTLYSLKEKAFQYPAGHTALLQAFQYFLAPSQQLILSSALDHPDLTKMQKILRQDFRPFLNILYQEGSLPSLLPWVETYPYSPDMVDAYLCQNYACQLPVHSAEQLNEILLKKFN